MIHWQGRLQAMPGVSAWLEIDREDLAGQLA
jgi:hypothetical protein